MSIVRFNDNHQWVRLDGSEAVVGITDYAQTQLGEIVHVDLPQVGKRVEQAREVAAIESVKVANELLAPLSGEVTGVNTALNDDPAKINGDPMGKGWLFKLRLADAKEFDALLDEEAYKRFVNALGTTNL
ncbi:MULTISPECIES: glycine cleavage system protein GcvH [Rhodopseudomonas]|uniref:Glycine cleavage system H protein n=1 Tax=Rhodopseudomonas palustris TaxID=1076 RepID=A0A0D7F5G1_RHOPL|nr:MULTISPECIES: glycine cleavage system protein GcvH [Rhodopseudomonas]KIZ48025.1 glycine cleavage system protein H [Rhodopseudomonas palustris]MDF3811907.1 glycine cleavage system protein GcvH [Rhodopseudomonas sp. BAL398]WOK16671.1 glycine cleavage system protein GcvH [Rhodopseudomonas sp. BAL398]